MRRKSSSPAASCVPAACSNGARQQSDAVSSFLLTVAVARVGRWGSAENVKSLEKCLGERTSSSASGRRTTSVRYLAADWRDPLQPMAATRWGGRALFVLPLKLPSRDARHCQGAVSLLPSQLLFPTRFRCCLRRSRMEPPRGEGIMTALRRGGRPGRRSSSGCVRRFVGCGRLTVLTRQCIWIYRAPPIGSAHIVELTAVYCQSHARCPPPDARAAAMGRKGKELAAADVDLTGEAADVPVPPGVTAPADLTGAGASGSSAPIVKPKRKPVKRKASDSSVEIVDVQPTPAGTTAAGGLAGEADAGVAMDLTAGASGSSAPVVKPKPKLPKAVKRKASDSSVEVVMDITGAGAGGASGSSAPVKPKGAVKRTASVEIVAVTQPQPRALPQAAGATQAPAMRGPERFDDELGTQLEEEDEMARLVCFGAFSTAAVGIQYYKGRAR